MYPNTKVESLLSMSATADFTPRDFAELALAALDQSDLCSRQLYEHVRITLDAAQPEGAPKLWPRLDSHRKTAEETARMSGLTVEDTDRVLFEGTFGIFPRRDRVEPYLALAPVGCRPFRTWGSAVAWLKEQGIAPDGAQLPVPEDEDETLVMSGASLEQRAARFGRLEVTDGGDLVLHQPEQN